MFRRFPRFNLCAAVIPPAAKKQRQQRVVPASSTSAASGGASSSSKMDPLADAKLSTDKLRETIESMSPEQLQELQSKVTAQDAHEEKILEQDSLYQMDVSLKSRHSTAGLRVFWKDINIGKIEGSTITGISGDTKYDYYNILLDGRKVKAFESTQPLRLPSEEYALAVAKEFSFQAGQMNKLLMPLTDLASGAQLVSPQNIAPRVDYLMSFFQNDNCYFRSEAIADKQDALIAPVQDYFQRLVGVETPRIVGLAHPRFTEQETEQVRQFLHGMNMNQYQIVAFCVAAQFTASIMLPLALFSRIITVDRALEINRMEEGHNIDTHGSVGGYHDIRESDVRVKISAAAAAWRMTNDLPVFSSSFATPIEEAELA
jgi:chaperone required for assembly of F1-ATPase